jgi:septal ring factor EnvC (AmiA/AmiB activator)
MIDSNVLHGFLDKLTKDAIKQIENEGQLSQQNALPFLIKDQYQKINTIESEFATKNDLRDVQTRIDSLEKRIVDLDVRLSGKIDELEKKFTDTMNDFRNEIFREMKKNERFNRIYLGFLTTLIFFCLGKIFA